MKLNFPKKEKHFKKENFCINKNIYWNILLFMFLISIITIIVFGYVFFKNTNTDMEIKGEDNIKTNEENRKIKIDKVLNYFKGKEIESFKIINNSSGVVDPSL